MAKINGTTVKREIAEKRPKGEEATALLSGFVRVCFSVLRHGDESDLWLDCQTDFVREYIAALMMDVFKVTPVLDVGGARKAAAASVLGDAKIEFAPQPTPNALVFSDGMKLLTELRIIRSGEYYELVGMDKRFEDHGKYYIRGVFLGSGSLSVPDADSHKSGGYHLEFTFNGEDIANDVIAILSGYGIWAHLTVRKEKYVVYVKDSENVSDCLALLGVDKTVLKLNETMAVLAVKSDITRRTNCDIANINRAIDASIGVMEAIAELEARGELETLDEKLRIAARARREYPDASLSELASIIGISKSGLKHRLDKLVETANRK